jgi:dTDP-4-dehydrorhamnose reductase
MARILVLGADGMVGHIARIYLTERGHDVISVARSSSAKWEKLDLEDEGALRAFLAKMKPEYVLNCAGVLIQESEKNPLRAIRLNALLPHVLEKAAVHERFKVIQVSSDCVFEGSKGPYTEGDRMDADGVYGRTKALGELRNDRDLTIRTSKVGPELHADGSGLFNWFMNQKGMIRGFTRALWGGVTTLEMVKAVDYIIEHPLGGLLHLTNGQAISKCDLLELFAEIWGKKDVKIERDDSHVADRSLICTRKDFAYCVPSYKAMMEEMRTFMRNHPELYRHYA